MDNSRKLDASQRQELAWLLDEADSAVQSWWQAEQVRWPDILTTLVSRLRLCDFDLEAEGIASDVQTAPKIGRKGCRNHRDLMQLRQQVVDRVRKRIVAIRKVMAALESKAPADKSSSGQKTPKSISKGGVTPMPPLNNDDESKTTLANNDRTESDASNPYHPADALPDWAHPPDGVIGWLRRSVSGTQAEVAELVLGPSNRAATGPRRRTLRNILIASPEKYFGRKEAGDRVRVFIRDGEDFSHANSRYLKFLDEAEKKKKKK